ncbi:MAG TPA: hypothetical protein VN554_00685, partial [Verrucomicrobiae bacterium]|nr:hypothetical protein [Verrucomicrobiae bacterium]
MSFGDTAPGDEAEFMPATDGQIEEITYLSRRVVDGALALASRRQTFETEFFEGHFFHHWVARYSHETDGLLPVDDEQA